VQDCLTLLDRARPLVPVPTRSYHRLSAHCYGLLGDNPKVVEHRRLAEADATPTTAIDHFLEGEKLRSEAVRQAERTHWRQSKDILDRAAKEYRAALVLSPVHAWSHFQLGRCYLSQGQAREALAELSAFVALRPDSPWGYSARGLALALMDQAAAAEHDLDQALALRPDFRPARLNRGVAYLLRKDYPKALADFDAVLQPPATLRLIEAAYYRGLLHLERGNHPAALEDFERVLEENPSFRPVYLRRAELYLAQGDDARGLNDLNAFLSGGRPFDADGQEAHEERGRLLRHLAPRLPEAERPKKLRLALDELRRAEELGGRSPALFLDLGLAWRMLGQPEQALAAYTRGLREKPDDHPLLVERGWVLIDAERYEQAQADFARVLRTDPHHSEAATGLGYVRACQGSGAFAQKQATEALLYGAGDYLVLHNVACIYGRLSRDDAARATDYQDTAVALLRRAVELWELGGAGQNEREAIARESAFPESMRKREDFRDLLKGRKPR
jgi:tetratricopeptide (TPR) repeat protein